MTEQRDWQKDMDWAQVIAAADEYVGWTKPLIHWLQQAAAEKERADQAEAREQKLQEAMERVKGFLDRDMFTSAYHELESSLYPKEGETT